MTNRKGIVNKNEFSKSNLIAKIDDFFQFNTNMSQFLTIIFLDILIQNLK